MNQKSLESQLERFIEQVDKQYPIKLAYLFGSFAMDRNNKESDIDLALLLDNEYDAKEELLIKGNIIDLGMKYFENSLDVVLLHNAPPLLKYEVIKNGIVLKNCPNKATFESLALREYFDFRYYSDKYNAAMIKNY